MAHKIGDEAALDIYRFLLDHTVSVTQSLNADKWVLYSEKIWENDIWDEESYRKKLQKGDDLGIRMANAFEEGFNLGFEKIIVIGSDLYDLSEQDLENAFKKLEDHDFVIGPAEDGGYYLLGMTTFTNTPFQNKEWGSETVLADTLKDLNGENLVQLSVKNDVDHYEDIKNIRAFEPFLKHIKE
ncbi:hypothetical protein HME9304_01017 [Flagellimonas maritima]|uniref:Glycosyltransferase n=1 Tax=Flagellimonas maritima TaxID=1383885 RepID=A0A2Z4LRZ5_9FLAO|nr:hypothetical protein HME9304_01017 [Allomuricauda aurantiaca]